MFPEYEWAPRLAWPWPSRWTLCICELPRTYRRLICQSQWHEVSRWPIALGIQSDAWTVRRPEQEKHMSTVCHSIAPTLMTSNSISATHNALVSNVFYSVKVLHSPIRRQSFLHNFGVFRQGARRLTQGIWSASSWNRIHSELTQYIRCWLLAVASPSAVNEILLARFNVPQIEANHAGGMNSISKLLFFRQAKVQQNYSNNYERQKLRK